MIKAMPEVQALAALRSARNYAYDLSNALKTAYNRMPDEPEIAIVFVNTANTIAEIDSAITTVKNKIKNGKKNEPVKNMG